MNEHNTSNYTIETLMSKQIRFWILLSSNVISLGCCVLLLIFLLGFRKVRQALNNHVVIVFTIMEIIYMMIDVPLYLNYLRFGMVWPQVPAMCLIWWVASDGIHETITILVAWAAFERHILILHTQLVSTRKKRFLFHYLPIGIIIIYSILFYGISIFFPPCEHNFQYTKEWCLESCLYNNSTFRLYKLIVNEILFTTLIAVFSVLLIIRIIWQRYVRLNQSFHWRKHRKMTIQLIGLSSPYIIFHLPKTVIYVLQPFDLESNFGQSFQLYMDFIGFFPEMILPFICIVALFPKPWTKQNRTIGVS